MSESIAKGRENNPHFFRRVDPIREKKKLFLVHSMVGNTRKTFVGEAFTIGEIEVRIKKRYPIAQTIKLRVLSEELEEI